MTARLSLAGLDSLDPAFQPVVDPRDLRVGIVHLGLGAFHRAHQAVFTENAMAATGSTEWAICGVTQRSRDVVDQLEPQDGLYTLSERDAETVLRVRGPLRELLSAQDQAAQLLQRIASPTIRIVTLTVTEKGYRHDPASGRLRQGDPEIRADADGRAPRTVVGRLVRGLQERARLDSGPMTVLCCDNLPRNGATLRGLVADFCALLPAAEEGALTDWIAGNATFPSSMVDRIVPATTAADLREVAATLGFQDLAAVVAEPFSQWVIEDDFCTPRPAWESAGVAVTSDVTPYEKMKLRLLNGAHSALAYLGVLAGYDDVAAFFELDDVRAYVRALMDAEVTPTLEVPAGFDLEKYKDQLMRRFANPALRHRTAQIAADGSQKLPQRLLDTIRQRLNAGSQPRLAALGVAGWMRYVSAAVTDDGMPFIVDDPLAQRCAQLIAGADRPAGVVDALLTLHQVFGADLPTDGVFRTLVIDALELLTNCGALGAVRDSLARTS
jgi:fructuronate reductase